MATTRTKTELAQAVMEDLGLAEAGEAIDSRDDAMIKRRYDNILEEIRDDELVYWEAGAIPYEVFEAVIQLMRLVVGPSFGIPGLVGEDLTSVLEAAKRRIRKRIMKRPSGLPTQVDYF